MSRVGKPRLYQVAAISMPLLSVVCIVIMGAQLSRSSNALDQAAARAPVVQHQQLPSTAATECCRISITSLHTRTGTNRQVTVTVDLRNATNTIEQISPGLQFYLIDTNGNSHPYTAAYTDPQIIVGGPLQPGKTMKLSLDFDMAPSETPYALQFQYDAASGQIQAGMPL